MIDLPAFPPSAPDQLTRKQGATYAQRVLRLLDGTFLLLEERERALEYAVREMLRVQRGAPEAAPFMEGVLSGLGGGRAALTTCLQKAQGQREEAARARKRATEERARLLAGAQSKRARAEALKAEAVALMLKADGMEEQARADHDRFTTYADKLERDASKGDGFTMHDKRFA